MGAPSSLGIRAHREIAPAEAATLGADYVVLGRSVTAADDPAAALARAVEELAAAAR